MTAHPGRPERPGRPLHPPLTDFPIAAYVFAALFDVISAIGGDQHGWARQFWHAGTFVLIAGASICVLTMLTGFRDLLRFPTAASGAVRSVTVHVCVMAAVFMIGVGDIAWRLKDYASNASTPAGILVLSLVAATGVSVGAAYGGSLVFRHGTGVAPAMAGPGTAAAWTGTGAADAGTLAAGTFFRPGAAGTFTPGTGPGTAPGAEVADIAVQAARHRLRRGK
jgi:uncharacterized membrane protein